MPSLSFDKTKGAKPIALVKGGEDDGAVLYLHEDDHDGKKPKKGEISATKYATELREIKPADRVKLLNRLSEARAKGLKSDQLIAESAFARSLYDKILHDETTDKSITLPDDSQFVICPSPDPKKREVYYIAGASGSGKSYIAKSIAEIYKKLHPSREIYLISKLEEDSTLDTMKPKPKRINIQTLIDDYPELDEFADCCLIFDDYDTFVGPAEKVVHKLIDDLATMGRHTNTTMLCLSHYLTNYKKTRLLLNEATHLVVYPMATSFHALSYLLKTHCGLTKDDCRDLKKMGRWVCLYKHYPQWLCSLHHARILNQ
jgi:energy-coupling factor transporter ATP-binding protein EcfA2